MNPSFEERLTAFLVHQGEPTRLFDGLVQELTGRLTQIVKRILGSSASVRSDVEDVVQDTLVACWRHRSCFDTARSAWAWLATTAHHKAIEYLRQKHSPRRRGYSRELESLYDARGGLAVNPCSSEHDPAKRLLQREFLQELQAVLNKEEYRVVRFWLTGFTDSKIADMLGITSEKMVYRLRQRSLKKLMQEPVFSSFREQMSVLDLVISDAPRQRFLRQEPAKLTRAPVEAPTTDRPLPMTAEEEADELVRRLYVRLGLISTDPSSPPQSNWDEFERLLFS